MHSFSQLRSLRVLSLALSFPFLSFLSQAQGAKQRVAQNPIADADGDHVQQRNEWFYRGRLVRGKPSAELRRRAYQAKLQLRARRAAMFAVRASANAQPSSSLNIWTPLGPMPLASDATGNRTQDYHQVSGRATAVVIDPADPTGNTLYIAGAQSGVWKSVNAGNADPSSVKWAPITDDQPTLSIGALAIQPGNTDVTKTVILASTGEADSSGDSYFGLGMLRSADAGNTWALIPTANNGALSFSGLGGARMAFSTAGQANTAVAAMATTSEGLVDGAVTASTKRGLYTSVDAGLSWTYDALVDPGGPTDATSATSVVYHAGAGLFFAAVRYHGFYSSPDGVTWTRLANQPGGTALSAAACPAQSSSNNASCPIYRGELTVVPGRNEMYAWFVYFSPSGMLADGGIWQSLNAGASWTAISDNGIANCGDSFGCGVEQGFYNLELLAVPSCPNGQNSCAGNPTDVYAGAINLYKCGITTQNPTCAATPFLNLTHVYGCDPAGAPAHVHPDQHALAYTVPSGTNNALMYFANDGGIYRALDGFGGLTSGSCSIANEFDDLNQNLGSMTQFVSFSQHPTDPNTLLGGTQDNGSPATSSAISSLTWGNVLGGDGGYNAIDPRTPANFYASNPDIPPGGLELQLCTNGVNCTDGGFMPVVTSGSIGGDDGAFYFPFILDPASSTAMLVGSCRVWRGGRTGGGFTVLSPNFDTLGSGTCSGNETNQVTAIAAGGPTDSNGSEVIYATTSGLGPANGPLYSPAGGRVWVTPNASAGPSSFVDVTGNGPQGNINASQFPVSAVAIDPSDATGRTAYITIMGFTHSAGHVWKTSNAGASWSDFTGNLPDSPVNAVVVYPTTSQVFIGTDVGVFGSSTSSADWTEMGPTPGRAVSGFLPDVAVTALGIFNAAGQQLLRASTYGRGIWQFNLSSTPDFQISMSNSPQTVAAGATATFTGVAAALSGFNGTVRLACVAGTTAPPASCSSPQSPLTPGISTPFSVTASGTAGDYYFNVQGFGSDANHTTHTVPAVLHVLSNGADFTLVENGSFPTVNAGSGASSGPISVGATSGFTGSINLSCSLPSGAGTCSVTPSTITSIPTTASVTLNAPSLSAGSYQMVVQGTSGALTHMLLIPFNVGDFQLSTPPTLTSGVGTQGTATLTLAASTYYSGTVHSSCSVNPAQVGSCSVSPSTTSVAQGSSTTFTLTANVANSAAPGAYSVNVSVQDASGVPSHNLVVPLLVQDFSIVSSTTSQTVSPGGTSAPYNLTLQPAGSGFSSAISLVCTGPSGVQCSFQPSTTVTPGSAAAPMTMTVSTAASVAAGTYTVTIAATSGSLSHSTTVALVVANTVVNNNDFQLVVSQPFQSGIPAGSQVKAKVSLTANYSGTANLKCDATAISGQCAVTPGNPVAISSTTAVSLNIAINIPDTLVPGTYNIKLSAADISGQPSHSIQIPLTIVEDFSVTSATPTQTLGAGQTTTGPYQLSVAPNPQGSSFPGAVSLTCSGLPSGAQCQFAPAGSVTLTNGPAAVVMNISVPAHSPSARGHGPSVLYAIFLFLPALVVGWTLVDVKPRRKVAGVGLLLFYAASLLSCGGVSSGGTSSQPSQRNQPVTYTITVTGTSPATPADAGQSTTVLLVVD